tara:strand:- start:504 stop:1802 length:1299 start_codon:yes stop_codon:yes gene_type:complete
MVIEHSQKFNEMVELCAESNGIVIPIPLDHRVHPSNSKLSGIYIFLLNNMQKYYIPIDHSEALKTFTIEEAMGVINTLDKIYVADSKEFMHIFGKTKVYDCNALSYHQYGKTLEKPTTPAHDQIYSTHWNRSNLNSIVPILKHLEYCDKISAIILDTIDVDTANSFSYGKFNSTLLNNLFTIENSGLKTIDGLERCYYNPYTLTGRPSNKFNKVNYAALNKSDGTREKYISRFKNGGILELDYDAYHLRLIANCIGYDLPKGSIHEYLGKQYFGTEKLTKEQYKESKEISFRILYGGVPKEFLAIPFFKEVNDFIFKFWKSWLNKNHFKTYLYKRKVDASTLEDMSPQKLFNYYIQSMETEASSEAMAEVIKVLNGHSTKLILYTYDSFTFDFNPKDGKELILKIKKAMKYPTKIAYGINYGKLNDVSDRFC